MMYACQTIVLYTLNLYSAVVSYHNKLEEK